MLQRGTLVIAGMIFLAVMAASVAWWHQFQRGAKVLELWGAENSRRIRLASDCELWRLDPAVRADATAGDDRLVIDDSPWAIVRRVSLRNARGFIHARQALIEDASYDWAASPPEKPTRWTYALCFRDATGQTVLLFDERAERTCRVGHPRTILRLVGIGPGLWQFFGEQLAAG